MSEKVKREYAAACTRSAVFDLGSFTKIELAGPDALSFLHNLCTNDVKDLKVGAGCEAFLTTIKARVVAHVLVGHFLHDEKVLWLDTIPGQAQKILDHLNHFLISERVELVDRTAALGLFRLCGPETMTILEKTLGANPPDCPLLHHRTIQTDKFGPVYLRKQDFLGLPGFDLFCSSEKGSLLHQALLETGAESAGMETHEILRIEAGFPWYGADIDENRLAMEVGRGRAISYAKGCYLGQETIVMARDRGQVNRMLMGIKIGGEKPLPPGTRLFQDGNEVGQVTSSVFSPRLSQAIALAYLRRGCQEPGTKLHIDSGSEGKTVEVALLPFV